MAITLLTEPKNLKNITLINKIINLYQSIHKKINNQAFLKENIEYVYSTLQQGTQIIPIADVIINYLQNKTYTIQNYCSLSLKMQCFKEALLRTIYNIILSLNTDNLLICLSHINQESGIKIDFHKHLSENDNNFEFENEYLYKAKILSLINNGVITVEIKKEKIIVTMIINNPTNM